MFRYQSHKKSLIMTALVLLLCLVSLTGATFALFTNDPNDGTIGIVTTTGEVKVDIVDTEDKTLQERALTFMTPLGGNEEPLFEPGATFYTQGFQVKNEGNIPVNFSLSVSKDEKIDMNEFNEAVEIWIATDPTNPAEAERITEFKDFLDEGESSKTYYLFIKMKETAGNKFQNKGYTGIGVTVCAVQGNVDI